MKVMMKFVLLFATALSSTAVSAFTVSFPTSYPVSKESRTTTTTTTALNLTPNQGSQLVDAYNARAQHAQHDKDDQDDFVAVGFRSTSQEKPAIATAATTTRVGIVSSTARALFHRLGISSHRHDDSDDDDVVYYPVIGFTYVPDAKDHSRALPTVSNPSCRLVYEKLLDKQALYGEWKKPPETDAAAEVDVVAVVKQNQEEFHLQS